MDEVSAFSQISRSQIQVSQYNSWNQLIEINSLQAMGCNQNTVH